MIYENDRDYHDFVSDNVWRILKSRTSSGTNRRACVKYIKILLNVMVNKIYNLYQSRNYYRRRANTFRSKLLFFGLFNHGKMGINTRSYAYLHKKIHYINRFIEYQDNLVLNTVNLKERFIMADIKKNSTAYNILQPKFDMLFIEKQNKLNALIGRDINYGCALAMGGILNNWSVRKWQSFNLHVCYLFLMCKLVFMM